MLTAGCSDWFDVESSKIMTEEQVYSSKDGVVSVLANIYSRLRDDQRFNVDIMNNWDE